MSPMQKIKVGFVALATTATLALVPAFSVNAFAFSSGSSGSNQDVPTTTTTTPRPTTTTPRPTTTTPVDTTVKPLPFNSSGLLGGNANPNFPEGEQGEVSLVQVSSLERAEFGSSATLLFAFRNNTKQTITSIDWTVTARSEGKIVATGSGKTTTPVQVKPGEVGLSHVWFSNGAAIPDDAEFEFSVSTRVAGTPILDNAQLTVTEANLSGSAIVGAAVNNTGAQVSGPFRVNIYCFDGDNLLSQDSTFTDQSGQIAPGGVVTFSNELYGQDCQSFTVGVSGFGW